MHVSRRISTIGAAAVSIATAATFLIAPTAAQAVAPAQAVATTDAAMAVSWTTPAVPSASGRITNTVRAGGTGHAGAATVISLLNPAAPTSYSFPLALPSGANAALGADGSVTVSVGGTAIGSFQKPWATDANGRSLSTSYTLSRAHGQYVLTQHLDTRGAAYPITADPNYTWGIVSGTAYYSRGETSSMRFSWYITGVVCAALGAWATPVAGVICGLEAGSIAYTANSAYAAGKCIKIKVSLPSGVLTPGSYTGGSCR
jgi:hypothetical protein